MTEAPAARRTWACRQIQVACAALHVLTLLGCPIVERGQYIRVEGTIRDQQTSVGVRGATIHLVFEGRLGAASVNSIEGGWFVIGADDATNECPDRVEILVQAAGYREHIERVNCYSHPAKPQDVLVRLVAET